MGHDDIPDCTAQCRSKQHGDLITAAISRRSVSDYDLCSYLRYICCCCESVKDSAGRTALHVASSCGRVALVKWLIQNRHAQINAKDDESNLTPLHRSIFYGKINVAVELLKLGANAAQLDCDNLSIWDHAMLDGFIPDSNAGELYVWGSNSNHSLGQKARSIPELLDIFDRNIEGACKVLVEKFHSVIVTSLGRVFACGHGQGGRLGLGTQKTVLEPRVIAFPENAHGEPFFCRDAAIARDHSIFLSTEGNIYTTGLNTHKVLGLSSTPPHSLTPVQLKRLPADIQGVSAGQYHSLAWGPRGLYTWGLNGGHLGHKSTDGKYINTPKFVTWLNLNDNQIEAVDSSEGAIAIYTSRGIIYVLNEYQCRKIASRQIDITQLATFGGQLDPTLHKELSSEPARELKVVALTNTGNILLWQESDPQLRRCIFSVNRPVIVKQVTINVNELLFVTRDGEAFQGFIKPRKRKTAATTNKSAFQKFLDREDCITVKITKFPRIHRAVYAQSDPKGNDYCVVQVAPYKRFAEPKMAQSHMRQNLQHLLGETQEGDDLHDVVFRVGAQSFPAHRFIVASKSSYFAKLLIDCSGEIVTIEKHDPIIFGQFLLFVYTGGCELFQCGEVPDRFRKLCEKGGDKDVEKDQPVDGGLPAFEVYQNNKNNKLKQESKSRNPVRMLHEMAKKFGCVDLCNILASYDMHKFVIRKKSFKDELAGDLKFDRLSLPDLYDVVIQCSDGSEVRAHKCILLTQSEYFHSLFSMRWRGTESSTTITLPCTNHIASALLEFLYTDTLTYANNNNQEHLFKLIILADQLFITRLKEQCEILLFKCLTIKNASYFLTFASIYNAHNLKTCCLQFIVSNITPLLELRAFDDLDDALLKELSDFYFETNKTIQCRVITPYSYAASEEEILAISAAHPVCLQEIADEKIVPRTSQKRRSRTHNKSVTLEKSEIDRAEGFLIQFPDSPDVAGQAVKEVVPNRLKAIMVATGKIDCDDLEPQFTKLVSKRDCLGTSFEEFPSLSSPPMFSKSPHKGEGKHKMLRISQKQRKRLSSENVETPISESPKNPWKVIDSNVAVSPKDASMGEIISSEKKQKDNLVKIRSKLLFYTQVEDKAIEDLCKFYNVEEICDENISVERVDMGAIAAPIWVAGVKKLECS